MRLLLRGFRFFSLSREKQKKPWRLPASPTHVVLKQRKSELSERAETVVGIFLTIPGSSSYRCSCFQVITHHGGGPLGRRFQLLGHS